MELRNRNVGGGGRGANDVPASLRDVALGPTIYGGERYSKMSERLKRQHKKPEDAVSTTKIVAPRLIGLGLALVLVLSYVIYLQSLAAQRRRDRSQ